MSQRSGLLRRRLVRGSVRRTPLLIALLAVGCSAEPDGPPPAPPSDGRPVVDVGTIPADRFPADVRDGTAAPTLTFEPQAPILVTGLFDADFRQVNGETAGVVGVNFMSADERDPVAYGESSQVAEGSEGGVKRVHMPMVAPVFPGRYVLEFYAQVMSPVPEEAVKEVLYRRRVDVVGEPPPGIPRGRTVGL